MMQGSEHEDSVCKLPGERSGHASLPLVDQVCFAMFCCSLLLLLVTLW